MKILLVEYKRTDYARRDYLQGETIHENRTYGVPKSRLCRGKTIYEGGLYIENY